MDQEQIMQQLAAQAQGGMTAGPSLEQQLAETTEFVTKIERFQYGCEYPKFDELSINIVLAWMDKGLMRVVDEQCYGSATIVLTPLGKWELARLQALRSHLEGELELAAQEERDREAAIAEREAELAAPHADFAGGAVVPADRHDREFAGEDTSPVGTTIAAPNKHQV